MSVQLHRLAVSGPEKPDAILEFGGESHLVFGPTDTGKSYVVECLRYGLGGGTPPRNIGYSDGYQLVALQLAIDNGSRFTIFRDLLQGAEAIYEGFLGLPPHSSPRPLSKKISDLLVEWSHGSDRVVLTKAGMQGAFTAGDLRYFSIFDEIETLDKVPLVGKEQALKMRRRSAASLILSGTDDSQAILTASTDERNVAKGHVEALEQEIQSLRERLPPVAQREYIYSELASTTSEIDRVGNYLQANLVTLTALKSSHATIEHQTRELEQVIAALVEAGSRFGLLDLKYQSDLERLHALASAAAVATAFEIRPCPLCGTDLGHQARHSADTVDHAALRAAALAESGKIAVLRRGLSRAIADVADDLAETRDRLAALRRETEANLESQALLIQPISPNPSVDLSGLTERRSLLAMAARDLQRVDELTLRLNEMRARTKRRKQVVVRDLSVSSMTLGVTQLT